MIETKVSDAMSIIKNIVMQQDERLKEIMTIIEQKISLNKTEIINTLAKNIQRLMGGDMDERQAKFDMMEKDMIQMKQFIHNTNNMRELDKEYFKKESSRHSTFLMEMQMSINESVRAEIDTRVSIILYSFRWDRLIMK